MRLLLAALALTSALMAGSGLAAAQGPELRCWSDWSEAAPVVRREALRPAKEASAHAQAKVPGRLLTISLCEEQGRYVYRMLILSAAGTVQAVTEEAAPTLPPGAKQQTAASDKP